RNERCSPVTLHSRPLTATAHLTTALLHREGGPRGKPAVSPVLREDLLDVPRGVLVLADAFFVLARDHLADEPEREELHADDDEQDAEDEERPLADRVALDLDDRQVAERGGADGEQHEPEPAEEVERAVPVTD